MGYARVSVPQPTETNPTPLDSRPPIHVRKVRGGRVLNKRDIPGIENNQLNKQGFDGFS